jgi:hypothetical protein
LKNSSGGQPPARPVWGGRPPQEIFFEGSVFLIFFLEHVTFLYDNGTLELNKSIMLIFSCTSSTIYDSLKIKVRKKKKHLQTRVLTKSLCLNALRLVKAKF